MFHNKSPKFWGYFVVLLPFIIYVAHSYFFIEWIIDDAGISYVYARNFAYGYGLVAQPQAAPVEGFSNFLWVLVLSPFFVFDLFDPIITPKIISFVLVLLTFIFLQKSISKIAFQQNLITLILLTLISVNPSFTIWTNSGLENPLYVFLTTVLFFVLLQQNNYRFQWIILAGVIAALIGLTRPDGVLYFFIFPVLTLADYLICKQNNFKNWFLQQVKYGFSFGVLFLAFLGFRMWYFGDIVPNTYHAKGGPPTLTELLPKGFDLIGSVTHQYTIAIILLAVFGITFYLIYVSKFSRQLFVTLLFAGCSLGIYMLLPLDWMGEYRFATPFIVFFCTYLFLVSEAFIQNTPVKKHTGLALTIIMTLLLGLNLTYYMTRSYNFSQNPTVNFASVAQRYGAKFNDYANKIRADDASVLLPDIGGTLYYSDLTVYDLAGLTDKTIARTLHNDKQAFYDYVFKTLKPTFIHTHGQWAYHARFDDDPRFRQTYTPIDEHLDPWLKKQYGLDIYAGDYVRIEILMDGDGVDVLK